MRRPRIPTPMRYRVLSELRLVPLLAWILAGAGFVAAQAYFNFYVATQSDAPPVWIRASLGLALGVVLGVYVALVGYVYRDARRRGMISGLWVLCAVALPNALGILVYFLLRRPLCMTCPHCQGSIKDEFGVCGTKQYSYCPYCGAPQDGP